MPRPYEILSINGDQNDPEGFQCHIFFNSQRFLQLKNYPILKSFFQLNDDQVINALRLVQIEGQNSWVSLPESPFASIERSIENGSEFLSQVLDSMDSGQQIIIKHYPPIYGEPLPPQDQNEPEVVEEINHHIDLSTHDSIAPMQLRRFRKCMRSGFGFEKVNNSPDELQELYDFLAKCRIEQGLVINIPFHKFLESFETCPENYEGYIVTDRNEIVAATVLVKVTSKIMYNYLPASTKSYATYSPMVFLMMKLSDHLRSAGFDIWDLGISSVHGVRQVGLSNFKESMGAVETSKPTYHYKTS